MRQINARFNDATVNTFAVISFDKVADCLDTLRLRAQSIAQSISMRLDRLAATLLDMAIMRRVCPVAVTSGATRVLTSYSGTFTSRHSWRSSKPGPGTTAIKR